MIFGEWEIIAPDGTFIDAARKCYSWIRNYYAVEITLNADIYYSYRVRGDVISRRRCFLAVQLGLVALETWWQRSRQEMEIASKNFLFCPFAFRIGMSVSAKVQFAVKRNRSRFLSVREMSYEIHFLELKQDVKATKMRALWALFETTTSPRKNYFPCSLNYFYTDSVFTVFSIN